MTDFWISIASASGTVYGEIHTSPGWTNGTPLDSAGTFSFDMPSSDPAAALILPKRVASCYTIINGAPVEVGSGIIDEITLNIDGNGSPTGTLTVAGSSRLRETTYRHVGGLKIGPSVPATSGPTDIMASAPAGWALDVANGYNTTSKAVQHTFEGETVLNALVKLAEITGEHFRAGAGQTVVWMQNSQPASGIRAFYNADPQSIEGSLAHCLITAINRKADAYEAYIGRVYAVGAGNGDASISLNGAILPGGYSGYALGSDSKGFYLEHTSTWAAYGIDRYVQWKDIATAQMLLETAYEYMRRSLAPGATYTLSITGLQTVLTPGSTIRVVAHQWVDGYHAVDIDDDLAILETQDAIDVNGIRTVGLTVSTGDRKPMDEISALVNSIGISRDFYTHTQQINGADVVGAVPPAHTGTPVVDRLPSWYDSAGTLQNSRLHDAISGGIASLAATLTVDRAYTFPNADASIAAKNLAQTFTANQEIAGSESAADKIFAAYNSGDTELIVATADRDFSGAGHWTGTNWAIASAALKHTTGSATAATLTAANMTTGSILSGRYYRLSFTVSGMSAGTITPRLGTTSGGAFSADGTYITGFIASGNDVSLSFLPTSTFNGSIDNIALQRVPAHLAIFANGHLSIGANFTPDADSVIHAKWNENGTLKMKFENLSQGSGAAAAFEAKVDNGARVLLIHGGANVSTTASAAFANRGGLITDATFGLGIGIAARMAGGTIDFFTEGVADTNLRMRINNIGNLLLGTVIDGMTAGGSLAITQDFAHRGTKFGAYNVTPAARPAAYTQTYSTATKTHANPTATTVTDTNGTAGFAAASDRTALVTAVNNLIADVANVKQVLNAVIDDGQSEGLLQ